MACKKAKGKRGKTRRKLKRKGSKLAISGYLKKPLENSRVVIDIDSSFHHGMPLAQFQGMTGTVKKVKKNSVEVVVKDQGKDKTIIAHPAHLNILGSGKK